MVHPETATGDGASRAPSSSSISSRDSIVPTDNDVLSGRNRGEFRNHPGNVKRRSLMQMYTDQYRQATPHNRSQIVNLLISEIKRNNGRLLSRSKDGEWTEDDERRARQKVAQGLRDTQNGSKHWKIQRKAFDFLSPGLNMSDLPKDAGHGHSTRDNVLEGELVLQPGMSNASAPPPLSTPGPSQSTTTENHR